MLNPLADAADEFKKILAMAALFVLFFFVGKCTTAREVVTQEHVTTLTHEVKVLTPVYITDTVKAYRTRLAYDTARVTDTVTRNDTVFVPRAVADSAVNSCTRALHDCDRIRLINDSLTVQLKKQAPGFWSHFACVAGPSLTALADGTVKAGVGGTCGVKVL